MYGTSAVRTVVVDVGNCSATECKSCVHGATFQFSVAVENEIRDNPVTVNRGPVDWPALTPTSGEDDGGRSVVIGCLCLESGCG